MQQSMRRRPDGPQGYSVQADRRRTPSGREACVGAQKASRGRAGDIAPPGCRDDQRIICIRRERGRWLGMASGRERVGQAVSISVVAGSIKNKKIRKCNDNTKLEKTT